jgi:hypothetical protein
MNTRDIWIVIFLTILSLMWTIWDVKDVTKRVQVLEDQIRFEQLVGK